MMERYAWFGFINIRHCSYLTSSNLELFDFLFITVCVTVSLSVRASAIRAPVSRRRFPYRYRRTRHFLLLPVAEVIVSVRYQCQVKI